MERKLDEYLRLGEYIENIEINDVTNREGHAAKVYFNALFGKIFPEQMKALQMQP